MNLNKRGLAVFFSLIILIATIITVSAIGRTEGRTTIDKETLTDKYPFTLPPLKYDYNALEPFIDKETMEIHYSRHHQAYINNANKALETYPELQNLTAEELLRNIDTLPKDIRESIKNNLGGHVNHSLFWDIMTPNSANMPKEPGGELKKEIERKFGSFENLKVSINAAGASRFGSGWVWLVLNKGELEIITTANQDSTIMDGKTPIFGIDLWEHAYYLKYQNKRVDYLEAFWNVVDWQAVEARYNAAK